MKSSPLLLPLLFTSPSTLSSPSSPSFPLFNKKYPPTHGILATNTVGGRGEFTEKNGRLGTKISRIGTRRRTGTELMGSKLTTDLGNRGGGVFGNQKPPSDKKKIESFEPKKYSTKITSPSKLYIPPYLLIRLSDWLLGPFFISLLQTSIPPPSIPAAIAASNIAAAAAYPAVGWLKDRTNSRFITCLFPAFQFLSIYLLTPKFYLFARAAAGIAMAIGGVGPEGYLHHLHENKGRRDPPGERIHETTTKNGIRSVEAQAPELNGVGDAVQRVAATAGVLDSVLAIFAGFVAGSVKYNLGVRATGWVSLIPAFLGGIAAGLMWTGEGKGASNNAAQGGAQEEESVLRLMSRGPAVKLLVYHTLVSVATTMFIISYPSVISGIEGSPVGLGPSFSFLMVCLAFGNFLSGMMNEREVVFSFLNSTQALLSLPLLSLVFLLRSKRSPPAHVILGLMGIAEVGIGVAGPRVVRRRGEIYRERTWGRAMVRLLGRKGGRVPLGCSHESFFFRRLPFFCVWQGRVFWLFFFTCAHIGCFVLVTLLNAAATESFLFFF